VLLRGYL